MWQLKWPRSNPKKFNKEKNTRNLASNKTCTHSKAIKATSNSHLLCFLYTQSSRWIVSQQFARGQNVVYFLARSVRQFQKYTKFEKSYNKVEFRYEKSAKYSHFVWQPKHLQKMASINGTSFSVFSKTKLRL